MGKLTLIRRNLFETGRPILAHAVNCSGGFGSGVAGQIAASYPEVREAYLEKYRSAAGWTPGDIQCVDVGDRTIVNLATQRYYGRDGGRYASLDAIRAACERLFRYCDGRGVAMPMLGCGLGGLAWSEVRPVLVNLLMEHDLEVDVHYLDRGVFMVGHPSDLPEPRREPTRPQDEGELAEG